MPFFHRLFFFVVLLSAIAKSGWAITDWAELLRIGNVSVGPIHHAGLALHWRPGLLPPGGQSFLPHGRREIDLFLLEIQERNAKPVFQLLEPVERGGNFSPDEGFSGECELRAYYPYEMHINLTRIVSGQVSALVRVADQDSWTQRLMSFRRIPIFQENLNRQHPLDLDCANESEFLRLENVVFGQRVDPRLQGTDVTLFERKILILSGDNYTTLPLFVVLTEKQGGRQWDVAFHKSREVLGGDGVTEKISLFPFLEMEWTDRGETRSYSFPGIVLRLRSVKQTGERRVTLNYTDGRGAAVDLIPVFRHVRMPESHERVQIGDSERDVVAAGELARHDPAQFLAVVADLACGLGLKVELLGMLAGRGVDISWALMRLLSDVDRAPLSFVVEALILAKDHANPLMDSAVRALTTHPDPSIRRAANIVYRDILKQKLLESVTDETVRRIMRDLYSQGLRDYVGMERPHSPEQTRRIESLSELQSEAGWQALWNIALWDPYFRGEALAFLAEKKVFNESHLLALLDFAGSSQPSVRLSAVRSLGGFTGERVEDILIRSVADGDSLVVQQAALEALTQQSRSEFVIQALKEYVTHQQFISPVLRESLDYCFAALGGWDALGYLCDDVDRYYPMISRLAERFRLTPHQVQGLARGDIVAGDLTSLRRRVREQSVPEVRLVGDRPLPERFLVGDSDVDVETLLSHMGPCPLHPAMLEREKIELVERSLQTGFQGIGFSAEEVNSVLVRIRDILAQKLPLVLSSPRVELGMRYLAGRVLAAAAR